MSNKNFPVPQSNILIYQTEDGQTKIQAHLKNETVWLSLNRMAELFQRDKSVISRYIRNIFKERELANEAVVAKFATTAADGKSYQVVKEYLTTAVDGKSYHSGEQKGNSSPKKKLLRCKDHKPSYKKYLPGQRAFAGSNYSKI